MSQYIKDAKNIKRAIKKQYRYYNIKIKITECIIIPHLKRYIFKIKPSKGTKVSQISDRAEDIQIALELPLFYVYKDGIYVHLVVSEYEIKENSLLKILQSSAFLESDMEIPLALGYEIMGDMHIADLAKLHHLLIVGPTGSGKSVAIMCLIISILVKCSVDDVRLVVFEIGSDSLEAFNNVPHLYHPFVKDVEKGIVVLESLTADMEYRYSIGEDECKKLPYLVYIFDEYDDTIASITDTNVRARFTKALDSLIRRARKAKIILVLASHNPTLKTTGINVNGIDSRICFRVLKHQNSATGIGVAGADKLPGNGAMIFKTPGKIENLQGAWVTDAETRQILSTRPSGYDDIDMLDIKQPETPHLPAVVDSITVDPTNKELADIIFWVIQHQRTSVHLIQKHFRVGKRAGNIIDTLHMMGVISEKFAKQPREVLITCLEDLSEEVVDLLNKHDYTTEQIQEVLDAKLGGV